MKNVAVRENHLYKKVYHSGRKSVGKYIVIYVLRDLKSYKYKKANPKKEFLNRIGLTVTSKIGGAVVRNRVKRILRAAYKETEKNFDIKKGFLVIIVARDAAIKVKSTQIYAEMTTLFKKLDMI